MSAGDRARGRTLRRLAAAGGLLAAPILAAVLVLGGGSSPTRGGARDQTSSEASIVQRRNLVEADTEAGTLGYAAPQTVYDRVSGTITWLPAVGREVRPGGTLFVVDGRPVLLMDGTTPAYRELAPGVGDGRDVLQLNRNLLELGFDPQPIALDDAWQAATTAGVEALQTSLGETATGRLALGQIVFLPGDQVVLSVQATLGDDAGGSGGAAASGAQVSDPGGDGGRAYASLRSEAAPGPAPQAPSAGAGPAGRPSTSPPTRRQLASLIARLQGEIRKLESARSDTQASHHAPSGGADASGPEGSSGAGASPTPVLQTASTRLVVTVELDASKQGEARVGERVSVQLPDGETVGGIVTSVSPVAQSAGGDSADGDSADGDSASPGAGQGSTTSIPVTVALDGRRAGAGLDQAAVSVDFVAAVARAVLSVPVTALLATGGADYAVQEAAAPHRLIAVRTGLFAAGYVQVSGPRLRAGLRVSDSQG